MQTTTHVSWPHRTRIAITALVVGVLMIPTGLSSVPAAAVGSTPGPIPSVSLVSRGANSVTMSWSVPWTDGGSPVTDYGIEVRAGSGAWALVDDGLSTETTSVVPGLEADVDYAVRVFAINENGRGPATVFGTMAKLLSSNEELCGSMEGKSLSCFARTKDVKSLTYYDYPTPSAETRHVVTDVIDMEGMCYLSRSSGVACSSQWSNRHGELGQGLTGGPVAMFHVPIPTDSSIISVSSDSQRNCALDSSRRLWCWGMSKDALGNTTSILDPVVVKTGVLEYEGSCARMWDGTVECLNSDYKWTAIPGMTPFINLASDYGPGSTGCGITDERRVYCFNTVTKAWSERVEWQGAVDVVSGDISPTCALLETGVVKCQSSTNYNGELGDGNRGFGGYATVKMPEPAVAIATNSRVFVTGHVTYTCAVGVSSKLYCWGEFPRAYSTGLVISTVPLEVLGGGAQTVRSFSKPTAVVGLAQTTRSAHSVSVSWSAAASTDAPVNGHAVRWSADGGTNWTTEVISAATTWTSGALESNSQLAVQVAARNDVGQGPWSSTVIASTTTPPGRPLDVHELSHTANSVTIEWYPSSDEDEPVTGYRIERSCNGVDWTSETVGRESWRTTLVNLVSRSAVQVRIKAINAAGESAFTDPIVVTTSGTGAQSVTVLDSFGTPVIGGRITWSTRSTGRAVTLGSFDAASVPFFDRNGSIVP